MQIYYFASNTHYSSFFTTLFLKIVWDWGNLQEFKLCTMWSTIFNEFKPAFEITLTLDGLMAPTVIG